MDTSSQGKVYIKDQTADYVQLDADLHKFNHGCVRAFNSLPNDNNLDWSKFKAFADDKINVTQRKEIA